MDIASLFFLAVDGSSSKGCVCILFLKRHTLCTTGSSLSILFSLGMTLLHIALFKTQPHSFPLSAVRIKARYGLKLAFGFLQNFFIASVKQLCFISVFQVPLFEHCSFFTIKETNFSTCLFFWILFFLPFSHEFKMTLLLFCYILRKYFQGLLLEAALHAALTFFRGKDSSTVSRRLCPA